MPAEGSPPDFRGYYCSMCDAYDPSGYHDHDPAGTKVTTVVPLVNYLRPQKTLRDEFAMAALIGTITDGTIAFDDYVKVAYHIADSMLEYRLKKG